MNSDELRNRFATLHVWEAAGQRAPNKPLLALWAIGRCLRHESRLTAYSDAEPRLKSLLQRFGPPRANVHPEYAFGRLQQDDLWEISAAGTVARGQSGDLLVSSLRENNAKGGFPPDVYYALQSDEILALEVACSLVDAHFPATRHDEVLEAVGLASRLERLVYFRRRPRDPAFSEEVLAAYKYQCAVCNFAVHMNGEYIALDAAHIKWHQAQGPDQVPNGLSLCSNHRCLFDSGAFTLSHDFRIVVSTDAQGTGLDSTLGRFHLRSITLPENRIDYPNESYLNWHHHFVFGSTPNEVRIHPGAAD